MQGRHACPRVIRQNHRLHDRKKCFIYSVTDGSIAASLTVAGTFPIRQPHSRGLWRILPPTASPYSYLTVDVALVTDGKPAEKGLSCNTGSVGWFWQAAVILLLGMIHLVFTYLFLDFAGRSSLVPVPGLRRVLLVAFVIPLRRVWRCHPAVLSGVLHQFRAWLPDISAAPHPDSTSSDARLRQRYVELAKLFRSGSLKVYTPLSLVLAVIIAWPLFQQWESALFYIFGGKAGSHRPGLRQRHQLLPVFPPDLHADAKEAC